MCMAPRDFIGNRFERNDIIGRYPSFVVQDKGLAELVLAFLEAQRPLIVVERKPGCMAAKTFVRGMVILL